MQDIRAFIVRPFGVKEGIDFDRTERELIAPALARCGVQGGTTGEITRQGNIRADMFRLLVLADLVVADVSIHNANVFYELGIRHGLQDRHTFLMRAASKDPYPFDLQTDRYFLYDPANPPASLDRLIDALRSTLESTERDSPVFQLLPALKPHDRAVLMVVPSDFQEDVERARVAGRRGDLRLLAEEVSGLEWAVGGLRVIGDAQARIRAFGGARDTFEAIRRIDPGNTQANYRLGTVYQRLAASADTTERRFDYLTRSEQAIERVLARAKPPAGREESPSEAAERHFYRAEGHALLGSNAKTRWLEDWIAAPEPRGAAALRSAHLGASIQHYLNAFAEDLDSFYGGINALAMLKIQTELARAFPDVWEEAFDDADRAALDLRERDRRMARLEGTLHLALGSDAAVARPDEKHDMWREISRADLLFLTLDKPRQIQRAYREALAQANPFEMDAARRNIGLFRDLGLLPANVDAALAEMRQATPVRTAPAARVVLFTGHMIDAPGRGGDNARFPPTPDAEAKARAMILDALQRETREEGGVSLGIAGGACGGDILFHEVCESLGIPTRLLLTLPEDQFQVESVNRGGPAWVERFRRLCERSTPRVLGDSKELPRWLADRKGYDIWQRDNLWMMFNALAEDARHRTLVALYNRDRDPDGPGGTAYLVRMASTRGFKTVELDARALLAT